MGFPIDMCDVRESIFMRIAMNIIAIELMNHNYIPSAGAKPVS